MAITRSPHYRVPAPVPALTGLPLLWLMLVALAFCINSSSYGAKAAVGPGFVSQIEQLVFASNSDPVRFMARSADLTHGDDADADTPYPTAAQSIAQPVPGALAGPARTPAAIGSYHWHFYQQAPRAPPLV